MPYTSDEVGEKNERIAELEAEVKRLRDALEAMHSEFASNFPDGERTAVDMARDALRATEDAEALRPVPRNPGKLPKTTLTPDE
jgi:hypothetical protein